MKKQLELFLTMLKIGMFTFGGGYAMIALLENEVAGNKKWIEKEEFLDLVAIAESTPGPIAINASTYIGYKVAGFSGASFATLGMCIPSFVIIFIISMFFDAFLSLSIVASAFKGIRICVVYLIFSAGMKMFRNMRKSPFDYFILLVVIVCMMASALFALNLSTISLILACGCLGLLAYGFSALKKGEKK